MLTANPKFKLSLPRQYLLLLILGIISGSIIFIWKNNIIFPTMVLYHELNVDKLISGYIVPADLLRYIAEKRFHSFIVLFLTQITLFKRPAACLYALIYGFAGAILEGFYVQQYGPKGIALFFITLLPHFLFYVLTWLKLCTETLFETPLNNHTLTRTIKTSLTCILFICAGIVCESTLNLWLLRFFYHFLL